jgi:hypothetical protein
LTCGCKEISTKDCQNLEELLFAHKKIKNASLKMRFIQISNIEENNYEKSDILKNFELIIQNKNIYENYLQELLKEPELIKKMGNEGVFLTQYEFCEMKDEKVSQKTKIVYEIYQTEITYL